MTSSLVLAHGIGGRLDLPVPLEFAQYGAAVVVAITFAGVAFAWKRPLFETPRTRVAPLVDTVTSSPYFRWFARALALAAWLTCLGFALFGDANAGTNPAPTWIYVWLWVGLIPASVLFGSFWQHIDPLATISAGLRKALRRNDPKQVNEQVARWIAAGGLVGFLWLELVAPNRTSPQLLGALMLIYGAFHVSCGVVYGPAWHRNADSFALYSRIFGHLSPWLRDKNGRLGMVNPLANLASFDPVRPARWAIYTLVGGTAFDGLTRLSWWTSLNSSFSSSGQLALGTFGLLSCIALVAGAFWLAAGTTGSSPAQVHPTAPFAHSLIPIAAGYAVAHYFSLFVFQGQAGFSFGGTSSIDYTVISTTTIAVVQMLAITAGHIGAVVAAHDRALVVFNDGSAVKSQLPLLTVMVAYTFAGIGLLSGG